MNKSARLLGNEIGLNSQEMNQLLFNQGYLAGKPGEYYLTDKAEGYASEKYYERGNPRSSYCAFWSTKSYDESILELLDTSEDAKQDAINQVREYRHACREERRRQEEADQQFRENFDETELDESETTIDMSDDSAVVVGVIGLFALGIYGVHKVGKWGWNKIKKYIEKKKQDGDRAISQESIV